MFSLPTFEIDIRLQELRKTTKLLNQDISPCILLTHLIYTFPNYFVAKDGDSRIMRQVSGTHEQAKVNYCNRGEYVRLRTLEVKGKGIRRVGGRADKGAYTVHTTNIISQRQYFVARCLISSVNVFGLHSICVCFPSAQKLVT
jgi:hypothetical protein